MLSLFYRGSKARREGKALVQGDSEGRLGGWTKMFPAQVCCGGNVSLGSGDLARSEVSVDPNVIVLVRLCSLKVENKKKLLGRKGLSKAVLESKKIK